MTRVYQSLITEVDYNVVPTVCVWEIHSRVHLPLNILLLDLLCRRLCGETPWLICQEDHNVEVTPQSRGHYGRRVMLYGYTSCAIYCSA